MWSRKYGCQDCHNKAQEPQQSKPNKAPNKVSSKRQGQLDTYNNEIRPLWLKMNPQCEFPGCTKKHDPKGVQMTIHHKKGKNGIMLLITEWFMTLCIDHHRYVELHREEAYKKGWLIIRGSKE